VIAFQVADTEYDSATYTAVVLFEFACMVRHDGNKEGEKKISEKLKIVWDVEKHMGTLISLVKQSGLSVSALNVIVRDWHGTEENANQCQRCHIFLKN
jgi:hypothetical protein